MILHVRNLFPLLTHARCKTKVNLGNRKLEHMLKILSIHVLRSNMLENTLGV